MINLQRCNHFYYLILLSLIIGGCAVGPDFKAPAPPKTSGYTTEPIPSKTIKGQTFQLGQQIHRQWWQSYKCEALNQLINQSLQNNPSLQAAQAAIRKTEENWNGSIGGLLPTLDAQGSASRQKQSGATFGVNTPLPPFNLYNVSLKASYTPDFFGGVRRQVEVLEAQVDFERYELEAAYLTLTTAVVTTVIQEALLRAQIHVTQELIKTQEKQLEIMMAQYRLGGVSQANILAQETLVAQTRALLPPLANALAQTRHRLSILVGELPSESVLPIFTLQDLHLPTDIPVSLPASLVQNRPDIKASEALLHQASAQIGVAQAAMFPQITLTGSIGDVSTKSSTLFANSSSVWSIGAQLLQPLFRGGEMIAKENAAIAAYDQAFAQYKQTVLQAFQQVADALQALVEDSKATQALELAERAAFDSLTMARKQYRLGALSFLNVLTVERQFLQTRLSRLQAEATRYADTANLFQALGGDCFHYRATKECEIP